MARRPAPDPWHELRNLAGTGDFAAAKRLLAEHPSLRDARNSLGETVLHHLAVEDHGEAMAWLHGQGFDLNARNAFGRPAVFEVALLGHRELLAWFVRACVDLSARDEEEGPDHWGFLAEHNRLKTLRRLETLAPRTGRRDAGD
ncbi:MAG: ankyrin repeat domain-containing protein [Holophagaceae bacterium]